MGALQKPKMGMELPLEKFKKSDAGIFEIFIFWAKMAVFRWKNHIFSKNGHFFLGSVPILGQKMKISKIPASRFLNFSRGSFMPIFGFWSAPVIKRNPFLGEN